MALRPQARHQFYPVAVPPEDGEPSIEGDSGDEGEGEPVEGEASEGQGHDEGEVTRENVHVSSADGDNGNDGSASHPWRSIAYAHERIAATSFKPITVNLAPGEYNEQVFMPKHTRLAGTKENDPSGVIIRPPVEALDVRN